MEILSPAAPSNAAASRGSDPIDLEVLRQRIRARAALAEDGDYYFALLGVGRGATSYEIKRAYLELRRAFEPSRLPAALADVGTEVRLVLEVLDEAFDILREPIRRERYRRAIEAGPP